MTGLSVIGESVFAEFKRRGRTILLVTHSLGLVERFCDESLWLDGGHVRITGDPKRVVGAYVTDVARSEEQQLAMSDARARGSVAGEAGAVPAAVGDAARTEAPVENMFTAGEGRWGNRDIEITGVELLGPDGQPRQVYQLGSSMTIRLRVHARKPIDDFAFGIGIFNTEGVLCYGTNTAIEELSPERLEGEGGGSSSRLMSSVRT